MTNEEIQKGSGLFAYIGFLNNVILHSKYQTVENGVKMMNIILKTYTLKDKRLLISAGALLFRPWGILGFVKDQIDGEYIENVEWPISEKKQNYIENVES